VSEIDLPDHCTTPRVRILGSDPDQFDPAGINAFRRIYKDGSNYVVVFDVKRPFLRSYNGRKVEFVNLEHLIQKI
jgi:hypothetical protein